MTKPVWSHVLALHAWTLKIAHIINYREAQTIPDCIRYINGVSCYILNHKRTFLLYISYLPVSKLRYSPCSGIHTSHTLCIIAQAL